MIVVFSFITLALFADPLNAPPDFPPLFKLVVRSWRKTCLFLFWLSLSHSLSLSLSVSYFSFIDVQLKKGTWTWPAGIDDLSFMMITMTTTTMRIMTYTGSPRRLLGELDPENFFTLICTIAKNAFMIPASRYLHIYLTFSRQKQNAKTEFR